MTKEQAEALADLINYIDIARCSAYVINVDGGWDVEVHWRMYDNSETVRRVRYFPDASILGALVSVSDAVVPSI